VVTVDPAFYEESLDWKMLQLVADDLRVERVGALPTKPVRVIGDIGVRGFLPMLRRILHIIDHEGADFLYITVPSFFAAPLGRVAHALRGIPYGIDYSDPWIHVWPGSERPLSKAWISRQLGRLLEPIAVRNAALITGVTDRTYGDVLDRNRHLYGRVVTATMPYGGEPADHELTSELGVPPYLFDTSHAAFRIVYAGTMWDDGRPTLEALFESVAANRAAFADARFHFIGTGKSPTNPQGQVRPLAERLHLSDLVIEHPGRISYVDVLAHLGAADSILVLGSTKPHYTPSKIYQSLLARRPIFAILHQDSPAVDIIRSSRAGHVLSFEGEQDLGRVRAAAAEAFLSFRHFASAFDPSTVDVTVLDTWSARSMTSRLAAALDSALQLNVAGEAGPRPGSRLS
jgi:hypothetical protein